MIEDLYDKINAVLAGQSALEKLLKEIGNEESNR